MGARRTGGAEGAAGCACTPRSTARECAGKRQAACSIARHATQRRRCHHSAAPTCTAVEGRRGTSTMSAEGMEQASTSPLSWHCWHRLSSLQGHGANGGAAGVGALRWSRTRRLSSRSRAEALSGFEAPSAALPCDSGAPDLEAMQPGAARRPQSPAGSTGARFRASHGGRPAAGTSPRCRAGPRRTWRCASPLQG